METIAPELELKLHTWANTTRYKQQCMIQVTIAAGLHSDEMWMIRYPRRMENMSSFMGIYHRYMIADLFDPTVYTMTASISGEIVGNAVWQLQGRGVNKSPEVVKRDSWLLWMHRTIYNLYRKIRPFLFFRELNWVNQAAIDRLSALNAIVVPKFIPDTVPTLFLKLLVVDPAYQRRGIGAALLDWGIAKAQKDGLRLALLSTKAGKRLYEKKGYELIDTSNAFHVANEKEAYDENGKLLPGLHCADSQCNFAEGYLMIRDLEEVEKDKDVEEV